MVKEICSILKNKLIGLDFLETIAGCVQVVTDQRYQESDNPNAGDLRIQKKMPVTYDVVGGFKKSTGAERALVPDEGKKGILYFEDFGTSPDNSQRTPARSLAFVSQIRVICWLNKSQRSQYKYAEVTALYTSAIIKRLCTGAATNGSGFTRLFCTVKGMPIQDANIFSRYNYDEVELQCLRPPFEYFAIDLYVKYQVSVSCLPTS